MAKQNINKRGKVTRNTHSPSWCDLLRKTTKASPAVIDLRSENDGTTLFSMSTLTGWWPLTNDGLRQLG